MYDKDDRCMIDFIKSTPLLAFILSFWNDWCKSKMSEPTYILNVQENILNP